MSKEKLLKILEEKGLDFDTRSLIVDDVLDIINQQLAELEEDSTMYQPYLREHKIRANLENVEIPKLQQQLKEKDEEIFNYKTSERFMQDAIDSMCEKVDANCYDDFDDSFKEFVDNQLKTNTKQVCEKIKENSVKLTNNDNEVICYRVNKQFLDQIEKGEHND